MSSSSSIEKPAKSSSSSSSIRTLVESSSSSSSLTSSSSKSSGRSSLSPNRSRRHHHRHHRGCGRLRHRLPACRRPRRHSVIIGRRLFDRRLVLFLRLRGRCCLQARILELGIELGLALRTTSWTTAQIVEFGAAARAGALTSQFWLGHDFPSQPDSNFGRTRCHDHRALSKPDRRLVTSNPVFPFMSEIPSRRSGPFRALPAKALSGRLKLPATNPCRTAP